MMRPLWLDYQRPAPGQRRPGMLLLGASLIVSGGLLLHYFSLGAELDTVGQQVSRLQRQAEQQRRFEGDGRPAAETAPGGREETAAAPSSARWEALFTSLEAASGESVTLLGLQPGSREIQIAGEAKTLADAMDYVKRLQAATALANVHLTQSETVTTHPQRPVRFALIAEWRGGAS